MLVELISRTIFERMQYSGKLSWTSPNQNRLITSMTVQYTKPIQRTNLLKDVSPTLFMFMHKLQLVQSLFIRVSVFKIIVSPEQGISKCRRSTCWWKLIYQVNEVVRKIVSDWRFDGLSGGHLWTLKMNAATAVEKSITNSLSHDYTNLADQLLPT